MASTGNLMVGLETPSVGRIMVKPVGSQDWFEAIGLNGVSSVNDLAEYQGHLYAAVQTGTGGRIYRSDLGGLSWTVMEASSPPVTSFRRLYADGMGQLLAGADTGNGPSGTLVFRLEPGSAGWQPYRGYLDMSTSIYDLLSIPEGLFAATGEIYGNLYRVLPTDWTWIYMPLVKK